MPRSPKLLTQKQNKSYLKKLKGWSMNPKSTEIYQTFQFPDYISGLVFIARVSVHAEILNHHPDITFSYGKVKVKIKTHAVKGLTKLDWMLAARISRIRV